jgi:hypothetical protein
MAIRRRIPTLLFALGTGALGLALGAGVLGAQAQTEEGPPSDPAAREAFVACAEEAGITLPDLREHRRDRERLSEAERAALAEAREACGHLLPRAEEREAFRQCLVDAGVLEADGGRPDRSDLTDTERREIRQEVRACAEEHGVERPRRCRPGRARSGS